MFDLGKPHCMRSMAFEPQGAGRYQRACTSFTQDADFSEVIQPCTNIAAKEQIGRDGLSFTVQDVLGLQVRDSSGHASFRGTSAVNFIH